MERNDFPKRDFGSLIHIWNSQIIRILSERVQFGYKSRIPEEFFMESTSSLKFTLPLKIVYSLTLGGVVAFYLFVYLRCCMGIVGSSIDNVFSYFLTQLNAIFFVTAIPLGIFTVVFLTKGGGLKYFRSWNKGKEVTLSSLSIIIGYVLVTFFPNTSIGDIFHVSYNDYTITYFGLTLMAVGFASVFLMYEKQSSVDIKTRIFKIKWRTRKTFLVFAATLIASVVIGGYHIKLQGEYESLQYNYQDLREGWVLPIDHNWTNIEDGDSKYINYKGAIFNTGLTEKYNVTLLVNIRDADGNWLKRAEIPIGDIRGWDYISFDVNVEYSGEMASVGTTFDYDDPNSQRFG